MPFDILKKIANVTYIGLQKYWNIRRHPLWIYYVLYRTLKNIISTIKTPDCRDYIDKQIETNLKIYRVVGNWWYKRKGGDSTWKKKSKI